MFDATEYLDIVERGGGGHSTSNFASPPAAVLSLSLWWVSTVSKVYIWSLRFLILVFRENMGWDESTEYFCEIKSGQ